MTVRSAIILDFGGVRGNLAVMLTGMGAEAGSGPDLAVAWESVPAL